MNNTLLEYREIITVLQSEHNIIQIHNIILWDWEYSKE